MNIKRAIWVGVVTYILSFIVGMVSAILIGFDINQAEMPTSFYVIGIIISIVLAGLFTLVYFRDKKIKASAKEGFYFGLVLIIIGFIMDIIIFSIGAAAGSEMDILAYYSNSMFWIALVLFVATTTIVGAIKRKKSKNL
ncbi:MAG: hypothetical protein AABX83_01415 [Nanoarchaeota archaeon]